MTARDIALGNRNSPAKCPVALAVLRCTGALDVRVGYGYLKIYRPLAKGPPIGQYHETPKKAAHFIGAFDSRKRVEPFTFELDL